jgi:hypothetical protein
LWSLKWIASQLVHTEWRFTPHLLIPSCEFILLLRHDKQEKKIPGRSLSRGERERETASVCLWFCRDLCFESFEHEICSVFLSALDVDSESVASKVVVGEEIIFEPN